MSDKLLVVASGFALGYGSLYLGVESLQDKLLKVSDFELASLDNMLVARHEKCNIRTYVTLNTAVCEHIYDFHVLTAVPRLDDRIGVQLHKYVCDVVASMSMEAARNHKSPLVQANQLNGITYAATPERYLNAPI